MDVIELHQRMMALKKLAAGRDCGLYLTANEEGFDVKVTDKTRSGAGAVFSRNVHPIDVALNNALNSTVIDLLGEAQRARAKAEQERALIPTMVDRKR